MWNLRKRLELGLVTGTLLLGLVACGGRNNPPPPPLPTTPTGPGFPGGGIIGGQCGGAFGLPIFPQDQTGVPFTGNLQIAGGMHIGYSPSGPGSVSLSVFYADNFSDKITGSAQLQIDIASVLGYPQGSIAPQPICVSTTDPFTGQQSQSGRGVQYGASFLIQTLVMSGSVQIPVYYNQPYPMPITVQVGSACQTTVNRYTRRLTGCVEVWVQSPQGTRYLPYYAN